MKPPEADRAGQAWDRAQWRSRRPAIHLSADDELPFWIVALQWAARHMTTLIAILMLALGFTMGRIM